MLLPYQEVIAALQQSGDDPYSLEALDQSYADKQRPYLVRDDRSMTIAIVCTNELWMAIQQLLQSSDEDQNTMIVLLRAYKQLKPLLLELKKGG